MSDIVVIAHNIRSAHNVGALFRTSEFLGVIKLILSGYTPHPSKAHDSRLPHEIRKITDQIHKTALGTESVLNWEYIDDWENALEQCKKDGYEIVALEQHPSSLPLANYCASEKTCIVLGEEVKGVSPKLLASVDHIVEIPRLGTKESLNVVQAAAIMLAHVQYKVQ